MSIKIKRKEATAIINSLSGGVVPKIGVQHITVGRKLEIDALTEALEDVKNGHSLVKFWIGEFGSGKSFILHLLNTIATKQNFVVSNADFTPENRLYANNRKALALYRSIIDNISIQIKPEGNALQTLLDKWIEQLMFQIAKDNNIHLTQIKNEEYYEIFETKIIEIINEITETSSYDFGIVITKYYEGFIKDNTQLKRHSLKWMKGEYSSKIEARNDLGVREIINDQNYYGMLKNLCNLFTSIGYKGFIINLDEAVNLYKISHSSAREKNYEKLLMIFNDCYQGNVSNLFINIAGTPNFLENERRGLFSYDALKTRLKTNKYETNQYRDLTQPVIKLVPINNTEVFVLLKKLKSILEINYDTSVDVTDKDIQVFMEEMYNKPGASEFLTPREVVRDFLNLLNILRQNPKADKNELISRIEIEDENIDDFGIDSIEEL